MGVGSYILVIMYLATDIGGTKTLVAVFTEEGTIIEEAKFATPKDYSEFIEAARSSVENFSTKDFSNGAIGTRGTVDRNTRVLVRDSILPWIQAPLVDDFTRLFGCNFVIENDSKAAGLSEAILLGNDFRKVLYVTISTGIGSAYIVDSKLEPNIIDSEIGLWLHLHDGVIKTWETFSSGKAIVEKYGKRASEIDDPAIWEEISHNIALGLINASAAYTPNVIILGGGVGAHYDRFSSPLLKAIASLVPSGIVVPEIRGAQKPEEAVIYGCYELARQNKS
jgi:predicted NBD/HSP70 family sugar kinase